VRHIDRHVLRGASLGDLIERIEEGTERWAYFAARPQYQDGYSNGYVYTTASHEDGECPITQEEERK